LKQVTGEFLKILDFADAVNLGDDPVEHSFNFLVGAFAKERSLAFQSAFVAEKLLAVKIRDAFPS